MYTASVSAVALVYNTDFSIIVSPFTIQFPASAEGHQYVNLAVNCTDGFKQWYSDHNVFDICLKFDNPLINIPLHFNVYKCSDQTLGLVSQATLIKSYDRNSGTKTLTESEIKELFTLTDATYC